MSEYADRVQFVLRYMPFRGNSLYASSALEEAVTKLVRVSKFGSID
jgi:hypothetical protein